MPLNGYCNSKYEAELMKRLMKGFLFLFVFGYLIYLVVLKAMQLLFKEETMEIRFYVHFNFIIFSILICGANRAILEHRAYMKECAKDEEQVKTTVLTKFRKEVEKDTSEVIHCDWFDMSEEAKPSDEKMKRDFLQESANTILEISFSQGFKHFPKDGDETDALYKQFSNSTQKKFDSLCKLFSEYAVDSVFMKPGHEEKPTFEDTDETIWKSTVILVKELLIERANNDYLVEHLPDQLEEMITFVYSKAFKAARDLFLFHSELVIETAKMLMDNKVNEKESLIGYFSIPEKETIVFEKYSVLKQDS